MKRRGVLCGVGGAAVLVVCLLATCSWPLGAQPPAPEYVGTPPPPSPPPTAAAWNQPVARWAQPSPAPSAAPVPALAYNANTIDDLLTILAAIKAQKAALEKNEKEALAFLREKIKQQKQRFRELGVDTEGVDAPSAEEKLEKMPSLEVSND